MSLPHCPGWPSEISTSPCWPSTWPIRSKRVIEVLWRLISAHEAPLFLRSYKGPEFVSGAILEWIAESVSPRR
jgi:hypothetical protein